MTTLKPWIKVVEPHVDVMQGTSTQSDYAVDLSQVVNGKMIGSQYTNPALFFQKTFITEGMKSLLGDVIRRLNGKGGEPVIQLQTGFGGGKTHSLLAVYHMVHSNGIPTRDLMGLEAVLEEAGCSSVPQANFAVIDGTDLAPAQPEVKEGCTLNTIWGRLAWSLGGKEAYNLLRKSDEEHTSPGKGILIELLNRFSPCVVLVDELVAYFRQLPENNVLPSGSFGTNLSFIQSLTEAVKSCPTAILLASLPESEAEAGDTKGERTIQILGKVFGRVHSLWKTAGVEESFEIVRRRLFQSMTQTQLSDRDAVCEAYFTLYEKDKEHFPAITQESHYLERLKKSYPFHPELFDLLYEYWAQLEDFQKTRGVLKLLSSVAYHLWKDHSSGLMIMPSDIPLIYDDIRGGCTNVLPKGWDQVIRSDIAGSSSKASYLDNSIYRIGKYCGVTRVATDIFIATAPNVQSNKLRGIDTKRLMLGVVQPGEEPGTYVDALRQLSEEAHYLFDEEKRYWFGITPNMNMEMKSRKEDFQRTNHKEELFNEIRTILNAELKHRSLFTGYHIFADSSKVPDDQSLRLVVLNPDQSFSKDTDEATTVARDILLHHGTQPRINLNRLIFLACDSFLGFTLRSSVATYLAWNSILNDAKAERLNIDTKLFREIENKVSAAKDEANRVAVDAYSHILCPDLDKSKTTVEDLAWATYSIKSNGNDLATTIEKSLEDNSEIITAWSPIFLEQELEQVYWNKGRGEIRAIDVWNDFCRYLYFPRLFDSRVFELTLSDGVKSDQFFGVASGKEGERYQDVKIGDNVMTPLTNTLLILPKETALRWKSDQNLAGDTGSISEGIRPSSPSIRTASLSAVVDLGGAKLNETPTGKKHTFYLNNVRLSQFAPNQDFENVLGLISKLRNNPDNQIILSLDVQIKSKEGFTEEEEKILKENFSDSDEFDTSLE